MNLIPTFVGQRATEDRAGAEPEPARRTAPRPPRDLAALTGIRGIAAWAVVFYHIRLSLHRLIPLEVIHVLGKGYLAVDLFFMLSGFVIWYNYAPRLAPLRPGAIRAFLWRRFARVYPLHVFLLTGFIGLALVLRAAGHDTSRYPFAQIPWHLLLIQNWGFIPDLAWNEPAWSISTEFAAYLVFPVLVAVLRPCWVARGGWLALAALLLVGEWLFFRHAGETSIGADISRLGLGRCLIEFALGTVLCIGWRSGAGRFAVLWGGLCLAAWGIGWHFALEERQFVPLVLAAGLMALAGGRGPLVRAIGGRALHYLGEVSYSTYLAHTLLFILFKLAFADAALQFGWTALAGYLAAVLLASIALHHGVERPAQAWLNRHPPRWMAMDRAIALR